MHFKCSSHCAQVWEDNYINSTETYEAYEAYEAYLTVCTADLDDWHNVSQGVDADTAKCGDEDSVVDVEEIYEKAGKEKE
jgi:hypothetical protein